MLRKSSLVECVSVLFGTCLQSVDIFFIHQYVQPCLSKNPKYTFYSIKSSLTLAYKIILIYFLFYFEKLIYLIAGQTYKQTSKYHIILIVV
jgi:hypothetical protein